MDNSIQAHQKELCNKLWAMANALRGNMEAYEFKNYILGMIFYYYLSDRTEKYMANLLKDDGIGSVSYPHLTLKRRGQTKNIRPPLSKRHCAISAMSSSRSICSARWSRW